MAAAAGIILAAESTAGPCSKHEILPLFFSTVWISLYYLAFYVVMSGLFALSIYSLMRTINPYEPDYQDQLKSPGTARVPQQLRRTGLC